MLYANRAYARGKFRCSLLLGLAAVFLLAAVGWAVESDPAPSPLFQQSLQGSIQKFQEGDRGGGTPRTLRQGSAAVGPVEHVVGYQAVAADLPSPTPLPGWPNRRPTA